MTALTLTNLRKAYNNGFEALKGINLSVETGDFFALLGPNGAGKSTMIGIIASLISASSGSVSIFGYDLDKQRNLAKMNSGLVPQEINFNQFDTVTSILVNQAGYYGIDKKTALKRAEYYLKQMDLWDKRDTVSRRLSGGMKRRVMIARSLIHDPKLVILDEPTAGVDIEIRRSMWRMMQEVNARGTTIILTTHYLEEAESLCRNIAIIDQGQIVEHTSMSQLLAKLHIDHFVLDLAESISILPDITGCHLQQISDKTLDVALPKEIGLNAFFAELSALNIKVLSLKNKTNRLEQLFLDLVNNK